MHWNTRFLRSCLPSFCFPTNESKKGQQLVKVCRCHRYRSMKFEETDNRRVLSPQKLLDSYYYQKFLPVPFCFDMHLSFSLAWLGDNGDGGGRLLLLLLLLCRHHRYRFTRTTRIRSLIITRGTRHHRSKWTCWNMHIDSDIITIQHLDVPFGRILHWQLHTISKHCIDSFKI